MNLRNLFTELKRRNVYEVTIAYGVVAWLLIQVATLYDSWKPPAWPCVFITFARVVVKANHSTM